MVPWDARAARWDDYAIVVVRTTWDYSFRRDEFVAWADRVGDRLHNSPAIVAWNSDKHYLADLGEDGIAVVETTYVAPGDDPPPIDGEVVVKPTVSGGGRDTGRFAAADAQLALDLIASIQAQGKTAMVQPFNPSVDTVGETAVVTIDGQFSHALRKHAVLRPGEVAPIRDDALQAAEAMYDPELVVAGSATDAEVETALEVVSAMERRFSYSPLYARVDLLTGEDGTPALLELEAIEPNFYHGQAPGLGRTIRAGDRGARGAPGRLGPTPPGRVPAGTSPTPAGSAATRSG